MVRRLLMTVVFVAVSLAGAEAHAQSAPPRYFGGSSDEAFRLAVAQQQYDKLKKSPLLAFGLEAIFPGLGNLYIGESEDAVLTWTGMLIGAFYLLDGATCSGTCPGSDTKVIAGLTFLIGSRVFGLTHAPISAHRNNNALRIRLGLDRPFEIGLAPLVHPRGGGLSLAFRF